MKLDISAIEKRCEAATPEPWSLFDGWNNGKNAIGEPQSAVKWMGNEMSAGIRSDCGCDLYGVTADFEFIAHSRQDIPALISEIRRLREGLGGLLVYFTKAHTGIQIVASGPNSCKMSEAIKQANKLLDTPQEGSCPG